MIEIRNQGEKENSLPTRSVTIKDLAAELGLSITTISRALNGYSDVGQATRERVIEAAKTHGYHPNRNAQRLVTRRTHNIAWIQSDNDRKFVDPHFVEVMAGVLRGARIDNYDIVLSGHASQDQVATYLRYITENSVDGFIVDLPQTEDARIDLLLESGKPFVVHGRNAKQDLYSFVDMDNYKNFYKITELMIKSGHRSISFINGDEEFEYAATRRRAVEAAIEDFGLGLDCLRIYNAKHPMGKAGSRLTTQALEDWDTTALIYSSVLMAVEGHPALVAAGREPCGNICTATMDDVLNYLDLSSIEDTISFMRSSLREAGTALIGDLIRQCERDKSVQHTIIPTEFILAPDLRDI